MSGWNGRNTVYGQGDNLVYDLDFGAEDMHIARDWKWLEFFYGYGWQRPISISLLGFQRLADNWILFLLFLAVFLALDLLFVVFLSFRALSRFLRRQR